MTFRSSRARFPIALLLVAGISSFASARAWAYEPWRAEQAEDERPINAKIETLGLLAGRFGVDTEVVLDGDDSLSFYGFVRHGSQSGTAHFLEMDPSYAYEAQTRGLGLDFQYRRYLVRLRGRPTTGLFIAPGFVAQRFDLATTQQCASSWTYNHPGADPDMCDARPGAVQQSFGYFGPSLDVGFQSISASGFTFAASFGMHDRFLIGALDTTNMPWSWTVADGPGLRPRLRVEIGWAFP